MRTHTSMFRSIRERVGGVAGGELDEDPERSDMTYPATLRSLRDGQF